MSFAGNVCSQRAGWLNHLAPGGPREEERTGSRRRLNAVGSAGQKNGSRSSQRTHRTGGLNSLVGRSRPTGCHHISARAPSWRAAFLTYSVDFFFQACRIRGRHRIDALRHGDPIGVRNTRGAHHRLPLDARRATIGDLARIPQHQATRLQRFLFRGRGDRCPHNRKVF